MSPNCLPWLLLAQLLLHLAEIAGKVPAIIVFGDSSVDAGNNNYIPTIARSNFKPYGRDFIGGQPTGRFCNGRLATDFISEAFGLPPTIPAYLDPKYGIHDFASGVCFASAGSGYDNATSDVLSVLSLWKQLEFLKEFRGKLNAYQGEAKAQVTLSEALYIISVGTNDFVVNYYNMVPGGRRSQYTLEEYQVFLIGIAESFIREIYQLGARKIDLGGIPPIGCLPLERATNPMLGACNEMYNKVARDFNDKLELLIKNLNQELHGIAVVYSNIYQPFLDVVRKPSTYGFEDATSGCCATGIFEMGYFCNARSLFTCLDANKYVFWDAFHPTERMNRIIADKAMNTTLAIFK